MTEILAPQSKQGFFHLLAGMALERFSRFPDDMAVSIA